MMDRNLIEKENESLLGVRLVWTLVNLLIYLFIFFRTWTHFCLDSRVQILTHCTHGPSHTYKCKQGTEDNSKVCLNLKKIIINTSKRSKSLQVFQIISKWFNNVNITSNRYYLLTTYWMPSTLYAFMSIYVSATQYKLLSHKFSQQFFNTLMW